MLAQVFRRFGMIFARTGVPSANVIRPITVALARNSALTIGGNGQIPIEDDLDSPFHSPVERWDCGACFVSNGLYRFSECCPSRRVRKGLTIEDVLPTGFNDCYHYMTPLTGRG